MHLREKRRRIKKTPSVVGLEIHKTKSDSKERLRSKISNAKSVVRPASGLSNTGSEAESGFDNGEAENLGNESIVMMCVALIDLLRVFSCPTTTLKMVNAVILKLPDVHPYVDFKTIS